MYDTQLTAKLYLELARAHSRLGNHEEARRAALDGLTLRPTEPQIWAGLNLHLARAYLNLKSYLDACDIAYRNGQDRATPEEFVRYFEEIRTKAVRRLQRKRTAKDEAAAAQPEFQRDMKRART